MSEKEEVISTVINVESLLRAREDEIIAFDNAVAKTNKVTSIFQRLPKHMRRRAMSHSIKRVPHYLRHAHMKQLETNGALKRSKRPSRKFRRRPKNLLSQYNRRQRTYIWLETHIWHAKRFRMVKEWGYKLPDRTYSKTFRASNRAISSHCLLQDISFYCCIELQGPLDVLIDGLKLLTSQECGLTFAAKCWRSGCRQGSVTLFHKNAYPYSVIGNVDFIWKPCYSNDTVRTIWIWCHPSFHEEIFEQFIDIFDLSYIEQMDVTENSEETSITDKCDIKLDNKKVEQTKLLLKNIPFFRVPKYTNERINVNMLLLKDTLNRFRLTGPLSNAILSKAFHAAENIENYNVDENDGNTVKSYVRKKQSEITAWWSKYSKENVNFENNIFHSLREVNLPNQFPPYSVIGGYIKDPRLYLPHKRFKAKYDNARGMFVFDKPLLDWPNSAIWDHNIRDMVTNCKLPTSILNKLRSNLLVPGHDEHLCHLVNAVVPILLIQRPGCLDNNSKLGYSAGWDIIFPSGWGMPVWLALILRGARPAGLREMKTIEFESKTALSMPPDSKSGFQHYKEIKIYSTEKHFRIPPNKRPNYIKLGFPTPFYYPWDILCADWIEDKCDEQFFVLRNKSYLQILDNSLKKLKYNKNDCLEIPKLIMNSKCLIPIICVMKNGGKIAPFSHICLPTVNDLEQMNNVLNSSVVIEKPHTDPNRAIRQNTKIEHRSLLKYLRKQRVKEKINRKNQRKNEIPKKRIKMKTSPTEDIVKEYNIRMWNLWIPTDINSIRFHCEREISGFIINSGFSFIESCMIGHGFMTIQSVVSLIRLFKDNKYFKPVVLVRAPTTFRYRFCELRIISS